MFSSVLAFHILIRGLVAEPALLEGHWLASLGCMLARIHIYIYIYMYVYMCIVVVFGTSNLYRPVSAVSPSAQSHGRCV